MTKIGDTLWNFSTNRRVYAEKADGSRAFGGPIFEKHFAPYVIVGEVARSWLLKSSEGYAREEKLAKQQVGQGVWHTDEQKAERIWMNDNAYRVQQRVDRCRDASILKQIDALLDAAKD